MKESHSTLYWVGVSTVNCIHVDSIVVATYIRIHVCMYKCLHISMNTCIGIPIPIVAATAGIAHDQYGHDEL